jgi:hypothetical protein
MIKEMDITQVPRIEYIKIDGLPIITPQKLLQFYDKDNETLEKDKYKIPILQELIRSIGSKYKDQIQIYDPKREQQRERQRERDNYVKLQPPPNAAAAQPAVSTELEFSDAESPVRASKPAARKPSLDDEKEFESPKRPNTKTKTKLF